MKITTGAGDIRVAIVGVGNCANSLVQGVTYYKDAAVDQEIPGLMHATIGSYHISNVKFVAAFDVDANGFVQTGINRFPITPFVVGPIGQAGYQTIQSALDAANAAGKGAVWVMPGTYTENLTFYPTSQLSGAVSNSDVAGNASPRTGESFH